VAFPGPVELGRGIVVLAGKQPPEPWTSSPRVVVGDAELERPAPAVGLLHQAWLARQPVVVELASDPASLRSPQRYDGPVHALTPGFEFTLERLQFLIWANSYDFRSGHPIWWHGRKAARLLAADGVVEDGSADIVLADGTPLFIDGGPPDPPSISSSTGVVHRWSAEAGQLYPTHHRPSRAELAPDQLAAVGHGSGAARVIAPAGSGKTRVLTERLQHLVEDRGAHPSTVTALAYNTRAADEMKIRCADVLTPQGPHIRTLNGIGLWICNEFGSAGRLRVLEESDVRQLLQKIFDIRRQANTDTVAPYLIALSAIRLGLSSPEAVEEAIPDASGMAEGFDRYRATLADSGAMDFDEQIYRAIQILVTNPDARRTAQGRCRRLLVDEFQDLTPAHLLMIRLLAAPGFDCFGVGDDDQVIYGYSGATPEFLIDFPRYFPGADHHPLEVNYRCPPAIVSAARNLLSYNQRRLEKHIRTPESRTDVVAPGTGPLVGSGSVAVKTAPGDALAGLAVEIITAWRDEGVAIEDIAVLARVNSALLPVQVACMEAGLPCSTPLGVQVLSRTGIRTAFAYLRIAGDPDHIRGQDVTDTIRRPSRGIAPNVVDMLTKSQSTSITDIRRLASRLSGRDAPKLQAYAEGLDSIVTAAKHSTAAALRAIRVGIGLDATMDILDSSRPETDRSTHTDELVTLESLAALHPYASSFEQWLRGVLNRPADHGSRVLLSTVHRIKGGEWGHVVIFGASQGLFPHRLSDDEEGERRVFHVALTRARTQVAVLADVAAPSIFIAELDGSRPRSTRKDTVRKTEEGREQSSSRYKGADRTASRQRRKKERALGAHRPPSLPTVEAVEGLVIEHGGHTGRIVEVTSKGAVHRVGTAQVDLRYGTDVRLEGRTVTLVAPGDGDVSSTSELTLTEHALRAWRLTVARKEGVPAYVVLNDQELIGITARAPTTLSELAECRGMGPIRLERWGDEILAVCDEIRSGSH
jgi:DNA helicase-2/ATP-dependent DNA helicase PcrA